MNKTRKIVSLVLSVAMMGILLSSATAQSETDKKGNLVANGGFEEELQGWNGSAAAVDDAESKDGKYSLKLDGSGGAKFLSRSQDILAKLKPSTEYILSADIKRSVKGSILVSVLEKAKADDQRWLPGHDCGSDGNVGKWEHFELKFKTGPEIGAAVVILYNISSNGAAWYDNISLVESK